MGDLFLPALFGFFPICPGLVGFVDCSVYEGGLAAVQFGLNLFAIDQRSSRGYRQEEKAHSEQPRSWGRDNNAMRTSPKSVARKCQEKESPAASRATRRRAQFPVVRAFLEMTSIHASWRAGACNASGTRQTSTETTEARVGGPIMTVSRFVKQQRRPTTSTRESNPAYAYTLRLLEPLHHPKYAYAERGQPCYKRNYQNAS